MTQTELVELARKGRIPKQEGSSFNERLSIQCNHPNWRTIVCDGEHDVLECTGCGEQRVTTCDFDDEYD